MATLRELLPDPDKLRILAAWIDMKDKQDGITDADVQDDLRRWSDNIEVINAIGDREGIEIELEDVRV